MQRGIDVRHATRREIMRTKRNRENSQHWKQKSCANCSRLNLIIFLKQKRKSRKERRNDGSTKSGYNNRMRV